MTSRHLLGTALGLLCLTVVEYRVVDMIQHDTRALEVRTAESILTGHVPLRTYQSRLLGPAMATGIQRLAHVSFDRAYGLVAIGFLLATNVVCFTLFRRAGSSAAWSYTAISAGLFVGFQDRDWLHIWDYPDALIFLVFAWAVVAGARTWVLVMLFACELLNREAALVIALWIALDAIALTPPRVAIDWRRFLTGLALMAIGAWWLSFIRARLFTGQWYPMRPGYELFHDQIWMLRHNLESLAEVRVRIDLVMLLAVLAVTAVLLYRAWRVLDDRAWKVAVLLTVMVATTFLFGFIIELRVWIWLQPFWLWLLYAERAGRVSQTQPQASK